MIYFIGRKNVDNKNKKKAKPKKKPSPKKPKKVSKKSKKIYIKNKSVLIPVAILLVVCLAVSFGAVLLKSDKSATFFDTNKSVVNGIDVSEHNGSVDWSKVAKNADFAFIRVGYSGYSNGQSVEDKKAQKNLKGANKAGIPVGVYFFSQAITEDEARKEAEFAINIIKEYDVKLPVVIDVEYPYSSSGEETGRLISASLSKSRQTKIINAFCDTVISHGYSPGVYASTYFYNTKFNPSLINKKAVKWVADYNNKNAYKGSYDIWQYTKTGSLSGITSKYLDQDHWYLK